MKKESLVYDGVTLGERIRRGRKEKKMNQNQLATRLGCSIAQLCRLEKGSAACNFNTLCLIAQELDVDILDLIDGIYEPQDRFLEEALAIPFQQMTVEGKLLAYSVVRVVSAADRAWRTREKEEYSCDKK